MFRVRLCWTLGADLLLAGFRDERLRYSASRRTRGEVRPRHRTSGTPTSAGRAHIAGRAGPAGLSAPAEGTKRERWPRTDPTPWIDRQSTATASSTLAARVPSSLSGA